MGALDNIASGIRNLLRRDKERVVLKLAKGSTSSTLPGSTYDLMQQYGYDVISDYLKLEQDLMSRFIDYESMDDYDLLSTILDIYGDDSTQPDTPTNKRVWFESPDKDLEMHLNDWWHRQLRGDEEIWEIARSTCKYGNDYEEIVVHPENGVVALNHLPAHTVRRVEGPRGELYGFVQDFNRRIGYSPKEFQEILRNRLAGAPGGLGANEWGGSVKLTGSEQVTAMEHWQVAHFRLRSKQRKSVYGYSVLEPARWTWKRLILLEDAAWIYRIQRAPERYAYYVDIGNRPPNEALQLMNMVRQQYKKKRFVNPTTGQLDLKYDLIAPDEDIFVPSVNGQDSTRIELLGGPNWQHMDDIEYFLKKIFGACKVPRAYLSQEEGVNRAILSSEDVRFARTILRVQRELKYGIEKIARVHLAALGMPPERLEFDVRFTVPSAIFELAQTEVRNARADLATRMREHVSLEWVLEHVFNMSEEERKVVMQQRDDEQLRFAKSQGRADAAMQKLMMPPGGGMESMRPRGGSPLVSNLGGGMESMRPRGGSPLVSNLYDGSFSRVRGGDKLDLVLRKNNELARHLHEVRSLVRELTRSRGR
jgi:hypothetical protein